MVCTLWSSYCGNVLPVSLNKKPAIRITNKIYISMKIQELGSYYYLHNEEKTEPDSIRQPDCGFFSLVVPEVPGRGHYRQADSSAPGTSRKSRSIWKESLLSSHFVVCQLILVPSKNWNLYYNHHFHLRYVTSQKVISSLTHWLNHMILRLLNSFSS